MPHRIHPGSVRAVFFSLAVLSIAVTSLHGADEDPGWPRLIPTDQARILLYQPQLESLEEDKLVGRAAVSILPKDAEEPVFGVIRYAARMSTDRDARTMDIVDLEPQRSLLDLGGLWMELNELLEGIAEVITENSLREDIRNTALRDAVPL